MLTKQRLYRLPEDYISFFRSLRDHRKQKTSGILEDMGAALAIVKERIPDLPASPQLHSMRVDLPDNLNRQIEDLHEQTGQTKVSLFVMAALALYDQEYGTDLFGQYLEPAKTTQAVDTSIANITLKLSE